MYISRKCRLLSKDRKQMSDCLEMEEGGVLEGHEGTFGSNEYDGWHGCHDGITGVDIC